MDNAEVQKPKASNQVLQSKTSRKAVSSFSKPKAKRVENLQVFSKGFGEMVSPKKKKDIEKS